MKSSRFPSGRDINKITCVFGGQGNVIVRTVLGQSWTAWGKKKKGSFRKEPVSEGKQYRSLPSTLPCQHPAGRSIAFPPEVETSLCCCFQAQLRSG